MLKAYETISQNSDARILLGVVIFKSLVLFQENVCHHSLNQ